MQEGQEFLMDVSGISLLLQVAGIQNVEIADKKVSRTTYICILSFFSLLMTRNARNFDAADEVGFHLCTWLFLENSGNRESLVHRLWSEFQLPRNGFVSRSSPFVCPSFMIKGLEVLIVNLLTCFDVPLPLACTISESSSLSESNTSKVWVTHTFFSNLRNSPLWSPRNRKDLDCTKDWSAFECESSQGGEWSWDLEQVCR